MLKSLPILDFISSRTTPGKIHTHMRHQQSEEKRYISSTPTFSGAFLFLEGLQPGDAQLLSGSHVLRLMPPEVKPDHFTKHSTHGMALCRWPMGGPGPAPRERCQGPAT